MAYIDNSDTKKALNDAIRGNAVSNVAPNQVVNSVQPVIDVHPNHNRVCNIVKSNAGTSTGATTIYTTPIDKDFYLVGVFASITKDATCDNTEAVVNIIIDGSSNSIMRMGSQTLTAESKTASMVFPIPVKIDRNTVITITATKTAGNFSKAGSIVGYTVEP